MAASFGKHRGSLNLNGLATLSAAAAKSLAGNEGDLSLNGLVDAQDDSIIALASHTTGTLQLDGLVTLSDPKAEALRHHRADLALRGVAELSDIAVQSLANKEGDLYLLGPRALSDSCAARLASHAGTLHLYGLESLTEEGARCLARHRGAIYSGNTKLKQEIERQTDLRLSHATELAAQSLVSLEQAVRRMGKLNSGPVSRPLRESAGISNRRRRFWVSILAWMVALCSVGVLMAFAKTLGQLPASLASTIIYLVIFVMLVSAGVAVWAGEACAKPKPSSVPPPALRTHDEIEALCRSIVSEANEPNKSKVIELQHCLEQLRAHDDRVRELRKRLEGKPQDAELWIELAKAVSRQIDRGDQAIDALQQVVRLRPDDAEVHRMLAIQLSLEGRYREAGNSFREVVRLRPGDEQALADVQHAKAGEVIESVTFRQSMKVDLHGFTMARYWNALGIGWSSLGKIPESLIAFRECLRLQPLLPAAWDCVAIGLLELPREDAAAFAAIRAVIAIQGAENTSWLRDKADVLRGRGRHSAAAEIERLLELDGRDPPQFSLVGTKSGAAVADKGQC